MKILKKLWNQLFNKNVLTANTEELGLEDLVVSSTFEYKGKGSVHTVQTIDTADFGHSFTWSRVVNTFKEATVIFNSYGCYLVVVANDFLEVSKKDRLRMVFDLLDNAPTGLRILVFTRREYNSVVNKGASDEIS